MLNPYRHAVVFGVIFSLAAVTQSLAQVTPGDADFDNDVDLFEVVAFQLCFESGRSGCEIYDFNDDSEIDLEDFVTFYCLLKGPDVSPINIEVDPLPVSTRDSTVMVTGTAPGSVSVEISGGVETVSGPVTDCAFEIEVALRPDHRNELFVVGILPDGSSTPPTVVVITQVTTGPSIFIDVPAEGVEITTDVTDVAGRVSATLTGLTGLTVRITTRSMPSSMKAMAAAAPFSR